MGCRADTPAPIRRLLRRALEKQSKRRLPDVGSARLEIDEALAMPATETSGASSPAAVALRDRPGASRCRGRLPPCSGPASLSRSRCGRRGVAPRRGRQFN